MRELRVPSQSHPWRETERRSPTCALGGRAKACWSHPARALLPCLLGVGAVVGLGGLGGPYRDREARGSLQAAMGLWLRLSTRLER